MGIVRYRRGEVPQTMSAGDLAGLAALMQDEVEANAAADPDNSPSTEDELERAATGRNIRLMREGLGLSQAEFARRFHVNLARLRDWEQGRHLPDSVARAYLRVIARDPRFVEAALEEPAAG
jgi:putative transcriptional regulator